MNKVWRIFWRRKIVEVSVTLGILLVGTLLPFYIGTIIPACGWEFRGTKSVGNCDFIVADISCEYCSGFGFYTYNWIGGLGILICFAFIIFLFWIWIKWNWKKAKEEAREKK